MARLNHFNRLAFLDFVESGGLDGPDYLPATEIAERTKRHHICLLYTSDAADE